MHSIINRKTMLLAALFIATCFMPAAYAACDYPVVEVVPGDTISLDGRPNQATGTDQGYIYGWTPFGFAFPAGTVTNTDNLSWTVPADALPGAYYVEFLVTTAGTYTGTGCADMKTFCFIVKKCHLCSADYCIDPTAPYPPTGATCPPVFDYPGVAKTGYTYHYDAIMEDGTTRKVLYSGTNPDYTLTASDFTTKLDQPTPTDTKKCSTIEFYITQEAQTGEKTKYSLCTSTICLYYDPAATIVIPS